jgi:hypothetical protein
MSIIFFTHLFLDLLHICSIIFKNVYLMQNYEIFVMADFISAPERKIKFAITINYISTEMSKANVMEKSHFFRRFLDSLRSLEMTK